jgi:hypothetical protein
MSFNTFLIVASGIFTLACYIGLKWYETHPFPKDKSKKGWGRR